MNKNVVGLGLLFVAVGLLLSDDKPTGKTIPYKKGASKPQSSPNPKTFNNKKEELQYELNILKQKKNKTKKDRDNIDLIEVVLKSM
jgi:hypothetical protein